MPKDTACAATSQQAQGFPAGRGLDGPLSASRLSRWDNVLLEALTYWDPDKAHTPIQHDMHKELDAGDFDQPLPHKRFPGRRKRYER